MDPNIEAVQNYENMFAQNGDLLGMFAAFYGIILALVIWSIIWKAIGLWRSARLKQVHWFIAILIFNSVGILPIIYILMTRKKYAELK